VSWLAVPWLAVPWLLVAPLVVAQLAFHTRRTGPSPVLWAVAVLPHLTIVAAAAVALALAQRQTPAIVATALVLAGQFAALAPAVATDLRPDSPSAPADAPTLRVVFANLYRHNAQLDDALRAVARRGADVIVLDEAGAVDVPALERSGLAAAYPFTVPIDRVGVGIVVRSRLALRVPDGYGGRRFPDLVVDVGTPGAAREARLVAVHVRSPVGETTAAQWKDQFALLGRQLASDARPGLVIGDFNATRWNGPYRRLLGAWRDVHDDLGDPWSASWPADRWFPPVVRLDHALVRGPLVARAVRTLTVPGSDHRGLEVDLALGPG
jgi:endonuclease/exonuclease/phosphatase (EEP) superfamily protein YafD